MLKAMLIYFQKQAFTPKIAAIVVELDGCASYEIREDDGLF